MMFIHRKAHASSDPLCLHGLYQVNAGRLPPHLSHLKDVYERLPDPHRDATASGPAVHPCARARRGPSAAAETLHGAQAAPRVILHEPPEAQDLDQHRRHQHEEQCESTPEVVLLDVVVEREP